MNEVSQNILNALRQYAPEGMDFDVPSPVFQDLGMRYVEFKPGKALMCAVPVQARFANPLGNVQSGVLAAAFDAAFGCLSHLLAHRPCESITMTTSFMEPISSEDKEFAVEVWIRAKGRKLLFLEGRVLNLDAKTVATASVSMSIYRNRES